MHVFDGKNWISFVSFPYFRVLPQCIPCPRTSPIDFPERTFLTNDCCILGGAAENEPAHMIPLPAQWLSLLSLSWTPPPSAPHGHGHVALMLIKRRMALKWKMLTSGSETFFSHEHWDTHTRLHTHTHTDRQRERDTHTHKQTDRRTNRRTHTQNIAALSCMIQGILSLHQALDKCKSFWAHQKTSMLSQHQGRAPPLRDHVIPPPGWTPHLSGPGTRYTNDDDTYMTPKGRRSAQKAVSFCCTNPF